MLRGIVHSRSGALGMGFALACLVAIAASLWLAPPAHAYETETTSTPTGLACTACHGEEPGTTSTTVSPSRKGPHGGYTTGTSKCGTCHFLHDAPTDAALLPAQTIRATCEMCHDGTGGTGVYGVIRARTGKNPRATHRIDVTNIVPAGKASGVATMTFSGENGYLTCSDCHSPHDSNTVAPFVGDRLRSDSDTMAAKPTNRLLKQRPGNSGILVPVYGSSWCGACHLGSLSATSHRGFMGNHTVETETAGFSYSRVVRVAAVNTTQTVFGTLGGSNFGYVMPYPRSVEQTGHAVLCQQCHEDARHVGDDLAAPYQVTSSEAFRTTLADGVSAADNPRFQTFPHEGLNAGLVVESRDDLCLNCHPRN